MPQGCGERGMGITQNKGPMEGAAKHEHGSGNTLPQGHSYILRYYITILFFKLWYPVGTCKGKNFFQNENLPNFVDLEPFKNQIIWMNYYTL
jgi:hypothetical protein